MTKTHSLREYKQAKLLVKDLKQIIRIIDLAINALHHYSKYAPVSVIISSLQTNKTILEIHFNKQKRILDSKGEIKSD
jgi:hypothetical protein